MWRLLLSRGLASSAGLLNQVKTDIKFKHAMNNGDNAMGTCLPLSFLRVACLIIIKDGGIYMRKKLRLYWIVFKRLCDFGYRIIDYGIALLKHKITGK